MTSKQRAYLMSQASTMDPIFQIGKASLTPEIITALDEALEKRELIKVSVLKNCADDPREIASVIGERTREIVLAHLSEECNTEEKALSTLKRVFAEHEIDCSRYRITAARQREMCEGGFND